MARPKRTARRQPPKIKIARIALDHQVTEQVKTTLLVSLGDLEQRREPDFGATGVIYKLNELLVRMEEPC